MVIADTRVAMTVDIPDSSKTGKGRAEPEPEPRRGFDGTSDAIGAIMVTNVSLDLEAGIRSSL